MQSSHRLCASFPLVRHVSPTLIVPDRMSERIPFNPPSSPAGLLTHFTECISSHSSASADTLLVLRHAFIEKIRCALREPSPLVAEYVLLAALSRVHRRSAEAALGSLVINVNGWMAENDERMDPLLAVLADILPRTMKVCACTFTFHIHTGHGMAYIHAFIHTYINTYMHSCK